ncbi:hypothetical protein N0V88_006378 [Collariella sp. IMI 366227]|nr:hypothetical protein N0V88_006378 [Collariella sp. IMI 366227]
MAAAYVVGDSSPFLKRVLIPFWVVRILIMLVQIGLYGLVITGLGVFKDDVHRLAQEYNTNLNYSAVMAISCIIMAIILLCLILDIVSIVKPFPQQAYASDYPKTASYYDSQTSYAGSGYAAAPYDPSSVGGHAGQQQGFEMTQTQRGSAV